MSSQKKSVSWVWVIVALVLFWPVGIILLFKKLADDKAATLNNGKTVKVISIVLAVLGMFALMGSRSGSTTFIALLFMGGGIWLFTIGNKMQKAGHRYKQYIALIVNERQSSIDNIAAAVGVSYEVAVKDLQKMIDAGYFQNGYINNGNREIVVTHHSVVVTTTVQSAPTQMKIVACPSCGANNTIPAGQVSECEYCGTPIQ